MPTPTTPRGYQLPDPANKLNVDVLRIQEGLTAIDADITALESGNKTIGGTKTFSVSPIVPTPSPGDATTKAATTAFVAAAVTAAINALISAAPGALDTLDELAAALGDDSNFAATVNAAIAARPTSTDMTAAIAAAMPAGSVVPFCGTSAPSGWLFCYGQTVSRTTYPALFSAIGTTFGSGDGSTTFGLPDLRGRVIAGKDDMGGSAASRLSASVAGSTLGAVGGAETHTLTSAQIPAHTHTASTNTVADHTHSSITGTGSMSNISTGGATVVGTTNSTGNTGSAGSHSHTVTVAANTGGDGAHNNTQPTIILNHIIKV